MVKKRIEVNPKVGKFIAYTFIVIFALGGIALCYFGHFKYVLMNAQVKSSWEQVPCKITSLKLVSSKTKRSNVSGKNRRSRGSSTVYRVEAAYNYEFGGQQYTGDRFSHQDWIKTSFDGLMSKRMNQVRSMEKKVCYVNPDNPNEAIVDPRVSLVSYIIVAVGAGGMLMSVLMYLNLLKRSRKGAAKSVAVLTAQAG